jgi:hypothetical protein
MQIMGVCIRDWGQRILNDTSDRTKRPILKLTAGHQKKPATKSLFGDDGGVAK